jgi:hypothetical protein
LLNEVRKISSQKSGSSLRQNAPTIDAVSQKHKQVVCNQGQHSNKKHGLVQTAEYKSLQTNKKLQDFHWLF